MATVIYMINIIIHEGFVFDLSQYWPVSNSLCLLFDAEQVGTEGFYHLAGF